MVAGNVIDLGAIGAEFEDFTDYLHVLRREIRFFELPYVDDVAVEHQNLGLYRFEVITNFLGVAAEGAEM